MHKIHVSIDHKALEDAGIGTDTQITRTLKDVKLRSALKLMLHDLGLTYLVADDVLLITTSDEANNRLVTVVYPVGDLVSREGYPNEELDDYGTLIDMITSTVQPTTWDEVGGPGSIKEFPHRKALVLSQTWDVHEEISDLLTTLRKTGGKIPGGGDVTAGSPTASTPRQTPLATSVMPTIDGQSGGANPLMAAERRGLARQGVPR